MPLTSHAQPGNPRGYTRARTTTTARSTLARSRLEPPSGVWWSPKSCDQSPHAVPDRTGLRSRNARLSAPRGAPSASGPGVPPAHPSAKRALPCPSRSATGPLRGWSREPQRVYPRSGVNTPRRSRSVLDVLAATEARAGQRTSLFLSVLAPNEHR